MDCLRRTENYLQGSSGLGVRSVVGCDGLRKLICVGPWFNANPQDTTSYSGEESNMMPLHISS